MPHTPSRFRNYFLSCFLKYRNLLKTIDLLEKQICPLDVCQNIQHSSCTNPLLKIRTERQSAVFQYHKCLCRYQQVFHPGFAMPSSACGAGVRKKELCEFLRFCHCCLFGRLYISGGSVSVSSFWLSTHVWRASPLHWTLPPSLHPLFPERRRRGGAAVASPAPTQLVS